MFCTTIRGVRVGASFSFFAVTALLVLLSGAEVFNIATVLVCCALHELGHLFFMLLFSRPPESIVLYGGGIRIVPGSQRLDSKVRDIIILLAGCMVNFISAALWTAVFGFGYFAKVSLLLGVYNLMPMSNFDGGRLLDIISGGRGSAFVRSAFILAGGACIAVMSLRSQLTLSAAAAFFYVALAELESRGLR